MTPAPTPPSGESAPPSLEERELVEILATEAEDLGIHTATASVTQRDVDAVQEAQEAVFAEFVRLRAEVARLTALLENAYRCHGSRVEELTDAWAERDAAEACAARLTAAVEHMFRRSDYDDVHRRYRRMQQMEEGDAKWDLRDSLPDSVMVPYGAMRDLRRALTEGADR
jgi:hypothetical protein